MRSVLWIVMMATSSTASAAGWGDDVWGVARWGEQEERCDGADQNFDGLVDEGNVCKCKSANYLGTDYVACRTRTSYFDADAACYEMGYSLVEINDTFENDWIMSGLGVTWPSKTWWTGGNDIAAEGVYEWPSGALFAFADWYPNQPDNFGGQQHCIGIWPAGPAWFDTRCERPMGFVCENITR